MNVTSAYADRRLSRISGRSSRIPPFGARVPCRAYRNSSARAESAPRGSFLHTEVGRRRSFVGVKPIPASALIGWLVVAVLVGLGAGFLAGAAASSQEVEVAGPTRTETLTRTVSSPSPVPETVSRRQRIASQGERLSGWTYRPIERQMLRNLLSYLDEGGDPAFANERLDDLEQTVIDRYNAAADRCFDS